MSTYLTATYDELLDIVDVNDIVIGQQYRSEVYAKKSSNFRAANAFLINNKKQIWIPRRAAHKKLFPLCLDTSVGAHVMAGETYDQAFARETYEELAVDINTVSTKFLMKITPHEHNTSAFMHFYIIHSDDEPAYNTHDFVSAAWYSYDQLQVLFKAGEPTKSDLPKLINILFQKFNQLL